jgi:hypothetical protein
MGGLPTDRAGTVRAGIAEGGRRRAVWAPDTGRGERGLRGKRARLVTRLADPPVDQVGGDASGRYGRPVPGTVQPVLIGPVLKLV